LVQCPVERRGDRRVVIPTRERVRRPLTEDVRDWDFHFPACINARRRRWYSRLYWRSSSRWRW